MKPTGEDRFRGQDQHSMTITDVRGREILDSRGNPTVEVDVTLARTRGRAVRRIDRRA
jgi:enolase